MMDHQKQQPVLRSVRGPSPLTHKANYLITYRNSRPADMDYCFQVGFEVMANSPEEIVTIIQREVRKNGGLKAELQGEIYEVTN